jgi:hypothetical protein
MVWIVYFNKGKLVEEHRRKIILKKLGASLLSGFIAFMIMYFAPGNHIRTSNFPPSSVMAAIKQTPSAINYLVFLLIPSRLSYLFIVLFAFIFAGAYFGKKANKEYVSIKPAMLCFVILIGAIIFTQFIFMYALSHSGPSRAYLHLSILFVITGSVLGYLIGINSKFSRLHYFLISVASLMIFLISAFQVKTSLYPTIRYTQSVNNRLSLLAKMKNSRYKGTLELDSLKVSENNFLLNSEIAKSPADTSNMFINNCVEGALNLGFKIELKK